MDRPEDPGEPDDVGTPASYAEPGEVGPLAVEAGRPTLLLALANDANRAALGGWLPDDLEVVRPGPDGLPDGFDLCVVDQAAFGRHVADLDIAKAAERPAFLPVLLLVSRDADSVDPAVWDHVDDLIEAPVSTRELAGRLRVLLRARRASTALVSERDRLEEVAGIMAHDLRNPLGVARGYVEHARQTTSEADLEAIERALDRMDDLMGDILALARHGRAGMEVAPVDLPRVVQSAWETVEHPGASLAVDLPPGTTLRAGRGALREALENLFRNAVEHAGDGVAVRVDLLTDRSGFGVEDDGPGIPPDEREAVLEFGHSTTHEGTGLGLAIVDRIAEVHGWELAVGDADAGGARFEFRGCRLEVE